MAINARLISKDRDARLERFSIPIDFKTAERKAVANAASMIPSQLSPILRSVKSIMARATTKEQLKVTGDDNFKKLFALIHSLTKEQQEKSFLFDDRDKNIRDVLVHLYEWHQLLLNWVKSNQSGNRINFLPEPYNWKTYPQMNIGFWEKHQDTPTEKAITLLENSHSETMKLIGSFTNEELFTSKYFSWTGTTSLGSYCVSATASHYDWAMKKIKKHKKDCTEKE